MDILNLIKSPMNYTGGKYKLLRQILPLFPQEISGLFVDVFCGGLDISINVNGARKVLANDINKKVIDIYNAMKALTIDELLGYIDGKIAEYGLTITNQEGYNLFREQYNRAEEKNPLDLFILICYSFNHQVRFNGNGEFNMPFGKDRSYFNDTLRKNLISFHRVISREGIVFTSRDFTCLKIDKLSPDDFIYCDPPYLITCATYNEKDGWNEDKERALYDMLDRVNEKGVKFALSNVFSNKGKDNEILMKWAEKYHVYHLSKTYSNCSYHAKDRDKTSTDEVLVTNYDAEKNESLLF